MAEGWVSGKMEQQWEWRSGSGGNGKHGVPCLGWCLPRVSGWGQQSQPGLIYWYQTRVLVTLFTGPLVAVPSILCSLPGPPLWARTCGNTHAFCFGVLQHLPGKEGCEGNCFIVSKCGVAVFPSTGNSRSVGESLPCLVGLDQWSVCSLLSGDALSWTVVSGFRRTEYGSSSKSKTLNNIHCQDRVGPTVLSTCSQHPHGPQLSVTPAPRHPAPSPDLCGHHTHMWNIYAHTGNTHKVI